MWPVVLLTYAGAVTAYHTSARRWPTPPASAITPRLMIAGATLLWLLAGVWAVNVAGWSAGLGAVICTAMLAGIGVCALAPVRPALARISGLVAASAVLPAAMLG